MSKRVSTRSSKRIKGAPPEHFEVMSLERTPPRGASATGMDLLMDDLDSSKVPAVNVSNIAALCPAAAISNAAISVNANSGAAAILDASNNNATATLRSSTCALTDKNMPTGSTESFNNVATGRLGGTQDNTIAGANIGPAMQAAFGQLMQEFESKLKEVFLRQCNVYGQAGGSDDAVLSNNVNSQVNSVSMPNAAVMQVNNRAAHAMSVSIVSDSQLREQPNLPTSVMGQLGQTTASRNSRVYNEITGAASNSVRNQFDSLSGAASNSVRNQFDSLSGAASNNVRNQFDNLAGAASNSGRNQFNDLAFGQTTPSFVSNPQSVVYGKLIELPKFSGDPVDWPMFERSFLDTTREFNYSNTRNIIRLRQSLSGQARVAVESLLPFPDSVADIMNTLKDNFGRPDQLVNRQLADICKIPFIQPGNFGAIVAFANTVKNLAAFMRYACAEYRLCDVTLLTELVGKLPSELQMQWAEYRESLRTYANIGDFSEFMNQIAKRANVVRDFSPRELRGSGAKEQIGYDQPRHNTKRHAYVAKKQEGCICCNRNCETLSVCPKFKEMSFGERWEVVKRNQLCFSCLKKGHAVLKCYRKKECQVDGCTKLHNALLHNQSTAKQNQKVGPEVVYSAEAQRVDSGVLFQILPVKIIVGNKVQNTYAFIDHGASHSMMEWSLAERMGLKGVKDRLSMQWLANVASDNATERVSFQIQEVTGKGRVFRMCNVYTVRDMNLPTQSVRTSCGAFKHKGIDKLLDYENAKPELVIGLDYAHLTSALEAPIVLGNSEPIVIRTRLGWVAYGPNCASQPRAEVVFSACCIKRRMSDLEQMMTEYFCNDNLGVLPRSQDGLSAEDKLLVQKMEEATSLENGRYTVRLLWRQNVSEFPPSYDVALRRLVGVENKMKINSEFAVQYKQKIEDYLSKGYARKLTEPEVGQTAERVFYLPHFAVVNPNKKGIRVVFDAAAEISGVSLNKQLLAGPDLNNSLLSILFKFRHLPIAICGDIREMFLQVAIDKRDQDVQRFLWRDGNSSRQPDVYVMTRMLFGATCSPVLAQFVKNKNAERHRICCPRAFQGICEKHYVDDYVDCFEDEEQAVSVVSDVIRIHKEGGFELRNFMSNSKGLLRALGSETIEHSSVDLNNKKVERVLGMHWDSKRDMLFFVLQFHKIRKEVLNAECIPTKREVLSAVMSVFDPFGLLANFLLRGKLLMQELWAIGLGWDEKLPDGVWKKWRSWLQEMPNVEKMRVPRCYHLKAMEASVELHIFADASESAMAAVAYFRFVHSDEVAVKFVFGKTRCTPLKYTSIPRLELQAAVIAVRIKETVVANHNFKISKVHFWTDSMTVMNWINSDSRRYKQYVANRLGEILEGSRVNEWHWVPTALNAADEGTRVNSMAYNHENRWVAGPEYLYQDQSYWPKQPQRFAEIEVAKCEEKSGGYTLLSERKSNLIDFERYSRYNLLRRAVARVLRFTHNCRAGQGLRRYAKYLEKDEIDTAENLLFRLVQRQAFAAEYGRLSENKCVSRTSCLLQLNPYLDDEGMIRLSGRIENAPSMSFDQKRLVILPKDHVFTELLVQYYHERMHHVNQDAVVCKVRERFWVPSLRELVRKVRRRCNFCKFRTAVPRTPIMGLLPVDRLTPFVRPFTYAGLDFFGPLQVSVRRQREKRWVALFTCLTTRAVHLELAADLSSDACILCIRNFINRRGVPTQIRSDNGTNFVGVAKELSGIEDFIDYAAVGQEVNGLGIRWLFNCPSNPSEGGAWERLVQAVKKVLYIVLKEAAPRVETLISLLIEAENIVNSRPLTHLPVAIDDEEPLTPNHFLLNGANSTQTPGDDTRAVCLRKQWRIAQNMKNCFWKRWMREYLPELTRRSKWCQPTQGLKIGDLVIVCESAAPRSEWKRGRVTKLHFGSDGIARSADVRTSQSIIKRPVSKLAKLDVM